MSNIQNRGIYMNNEENILKELWLGNIYPIEKIRENPDAEITKISNEIDRLHYIITDKMKNDELFNKFNEYEKMHGRYEEIIAEKSFGLGFSLATKLLSASFNK